MSSADKLLSVLQLFSLERPEWTVEEAADELSVSGSTAYRYFSSLGKAGLLDPITGGRYILGPAIIAYDRQLRLSDPLVRIARPVLERLIQRNGGEGVALLCRRFRQQVMCVHQAFDRKPPYAISYERGRPMGLYRGASSRVILANLPWRTLRAKWGVEAAEMEAAGLGASWAEVRKTLGAIRSTGVEVARGQIDPGMMGVAAPIWQADGQVAGSVSLVVPASTSNAGYLAGLTALVTAAGKEIDAGLAPVETQMVV
jgi:DNA-binding IclR family transcriptional regulator